MASDSNLIRASFALGQAQAASSVQDMGPLYRAEGEAYKQIGNVALGILDEMVRENKALKLAKTKQLQPLKNKFNEMYQSLYAAKEPLPQSFVDAVEEQVAMLQDEFEAVNTIGKGDTRENERARNRIMGKLAKLKNSVVSFRGNLMKVSGAVDNLDENNIQPEDIDPITFVSDIKKWDEYVARGDMEYVFKDGIVNLSVKNYRTGQRAVTVDPAEQAVDEFGEVIVGDAERYEEYQYGDLITFNIEEMADRLPTRPKALEAGIVANYNTSKTAAESHAKMEGAKRRGYMFDRDVNISKYNADLNDEKELQFLMKNSVSGIGGNSFHDDLLVSGIINRESALILGYDEDSFNMLDKDGDGDIDLRDKEMVSGQDRELWKYNTRTMIDAITNRYNSNYNFGLSKELFINWQVDREQQRYENSYDSVHKKLNPNDYKVLPEDLAKVPGNYKVGSNGYLINPALRNESGRFGKQEFFGYKLNKQGNVLYDDEAVSRAIDNGQSFIDAFGNKYEKVERDGKFVGYNISGLKEGGESITFITFVKPEKARLWAVNKPKIDSNNI